MSEDNLDLQKMSEFGKKSRGDLKRCCGCFDDQYRSQG